MGDKQKALAVVHPPRGPASGAGLGVGSGSAGLVGLRGGRAVRMSVPDAPLFQIVLQEVTPVVHGLGGLDLEVHAVAQLVNLAEDLFELLAAEQVAQLSATHGNQEEDVPHDDGQPLEESAQVVQDRK